MVSKIRRKKYIVYIKDVPRHMHFQTGNDQYMFYIIVSNLITYIQIACKLFWVMKSLAEVDQENRTLCPYVTKLKT